MNIPRVFSTYVAAIAAATSVHAVSKADLDRVTPVPANEPIPAVDFFRQPLLNSPQLNRAGTHVAAMISSNDSHVQLLVQDLATQKFEYLIAPDEMDVTSFAWLDDNHILFDVQYNRMFVAKVGDFKHAYRVIEYCFAELVGVPEANRMRPVLRTHFFDAHDRTGLVISLKADLADTRPVNLNVREINGIDIRELNQEHIAAEFPRPGGIDSNFYADKLGELAFAKTYKDGIPELKQYTKDGWRTCPVDPEQLRIVCAGDQPGEAVVVARGPVGTPSKLQFMDGATGALGKVLLQDPGYDFNGWLFRDPGTHDIVGAVYDRTMPTVIWFNEAYSKLQKVVDAFFPGHIVRIIDGGRAGKKFLLCTWSDRQPVTYYILDVEKNTVGLLKSSAPWLDSKRLSPTSVMQFKTRDGHKLDAYVTIPAGASKANPVPLVVLPVGNPWGRLTAEFDTTAQFFASRGYAVLRPNHRWAAGYMWMFPNEDEWAFDKMAQDINDATKTLLRSGIIDRQRIAIGGSAFGGTFALSAVVDEPDLYHAAITIQGIFDFGAHINEQKINEHTDPKYDLFVRKLGNPSKDKEKLDAISPARRGERIHCPVFIAQHKLASGESTLQSRRLTSALARVRQSGPCFRKFWGSAKRKWFA